jgi:hypothetical protein
MGRPLTATRLREVLDYDAESGEFRWKIRPSNRVRIGDVAGRLCDGYRRIALDGREYSGHRLAVLWVEGRYPRHQVWHRNGLRGDNRYENLKQPRRSARRRAPVIQAEEGARP